LRILIGYDGSECAKAALLDLRRAGLPSEAEVIVMAVADVFVPPPDDTEADRTFPRYMPTSISRAHEHAKQEVAQALALAEAAMTQLATLFPHWEIHAESSADSPAWALIKRADQWKPDLIIVGSHGHTATGGRFILGSVSQRVLYEARTSVRVARGRMNGEEMPLRIVVGMDGSPDSYAAVSAVAERSWPKGSEARLVVVLDTVMFLTPDPSAPETVKWFEVANQSDLNQLGKTFKSAADNLRKVGLSSSVILTTGNPKVAIVEEAESWNADSIFVGAKGARGIDRFLLGSVSAAVAARAHCSVEVVRRRSIVE